MYSKYLAVALTLLANTSLVTCKCPETSTVLVTSTVTTTLKTRDEGKPTTCPNPRKIVTVTTTFTAPPSTSTVTVTKDVGHTKASKTNAVPTETEGFTNGDFESGSLAPWTFEPDGDATAYVATPGYAATYAAYLTCTSNNRYTAFAYLKQSFNWTRGYTYDVSFAYEYFSNTSAGTQLILTMDGAGYDAETAITFNGAGNPDTEGNPAGSWATPSPLMRLAKMNEAVIEITLTCLPYTEASVAIDDINVSPVFAPYTAIAPSNTPAACACSQAPSMSPI